MSGLLNGGDASGVEPRAFHAFPWERPGVACRLLVSGGTLAVRRPDGETTTYYAPGVQEIGPEDEIQIRVRAASHGSTATAHVFADATSLAIGRRAGVAASRGPTPNIVPVSPQGVNARIVVDLVETPWRDGIIETWARRYKAGPTGLEHDGDDLLHTEEWGYPAPTGGDRLTPVIRCASSPSGRFIVVGGNFAYQTIYDTARRTVWPIERWTLGTPNAEPAFLTDSMLICGGKIFRRADNGVWVRQTGPNFTLPFTFTRVVRLGNGQTWGIGQSNTRSPWQAVRILEDGSVGTIASALRVSTTSTLGVSSWQIVPGSGTEAVVLHSGPGASSDRLRDVTLTHLEFPSVMNAQANLLSDRALDLGKQRSVSIEHIGDNRFLAFQLDPEGLRYAEFWLRDGGLEQVRDWQRVNPANHGGWGRKDAQSTYSSFTSKFTDRQGRFATVSTPQTISLMEIDFAGATQSSTYRVVAAERVVLPEPPVTEEPTPDPEVVPPPPLPGQALIFETV